MDEINVNELIERIKREVKEQPEVKEEFPDIEDDVIIIEFWVLESSYVDGEEGIMLFVPPVLEDIVWKVKEKIESPRLFISVLRISEGNFVKTVVLKRLKREFPHIKVGEEIEKVEGNGYALYLNWTNRGMVIHKYKEGKFSSMCKKTNVWMTNNGVWIINFSSCEEVNKAVKLIKEIIYKYFDIDYSANYHKRCGAIECKPDKSEL
jgi:hypothetical protein